MNWVVGLGLLTSGLLGYLLGVLPNQAGFLRRPAVQDSMYLIFSGTFLGFVISIVLPHVVQAEMFSALGFAAGLGLMALLNKKIIHHDVCCAHGQETKDFGLLSLGAMAICSTNDGVFIGLVNPGPLSLISISLFIHKLTISFMVAQIIHACSLHLKNKIFLGVLYLVISPLTYALVLVFGFSLEGLLNPLLGFSGGMLTYVALAGTWPRIRKIPLSAGYQYAWLIFPLVISLVLGMVHIGVHGVFGHSH